MQHMKRAAETAALQRGFLCCDHADDQTPSPPADELLAAKRPVQGIVVADRGGRDRGCEAGMPIVDTWLSYSPKDTYLRAFIVGIVNTLRVAVIGIVLATILGTIVGISRLSPNWLLSRLAAVYVEVLRDIPLLLQLLFWYVLMQALPAARAAFSPISGVYLSNRGLVLPSIPIGTGQLWVLGTALLGLLVLYVVRRHLIARQM